jgi:predicted transcriptional regulator
MKAIVVGILPQDRIRERVLAIARGEYKPNPCEPKIWFTSMQSLTEAVGDDNLPLVKIVQPSKTQSVSSSANKQGT